MVSKGKGSRSGFGKKRMAKRSLHQIRALSHLPGGPGRGHERSLPPVHPWWCIADRQTAKKKEYRAAWLMLTRTQGKSEDS